MERFLLSARMIWTGVRESLTAWMILIAVLLLLLAAFRCYTPTVKLGKKKLKKVHDTVASYLPSRKNRVSLEVDISAKDLRDLQKDAEYTERMLLAWWYDHGDDYRVKNAIQVVKKIQKGLEAAKQQGLRDDPKAMGHLFRNIEAQAEAGLKILSDY